MTRIKKRRSGKNRTADQKKSAAGRRRAQKAEKANASKDRVMEAVKADLTPEKKAAYKKSFQPVQSGRRNRAGKKQTTAKNENSGFKANTETGNLPLQQKKTGKTRSAGARRVAAAKNIAPNFKNKATSKKIFPPKKEESATTSPQKGFAPWNKNKFKGKKRG